MTLDAFISLMTSRGYSGAEIFIGPGQWELTFEMPVAYALGTPRVSGEGNTATAAIAEVEKDWEAKHERHEAFGKSERDRIAEIRKAEARNLRQRAEEIEARLAEDA